MEPIVYGAIFLVIMIVLFRVLKNLKVILMIAIAGFFAYYLTNYVTKDKDLSSENMGKKVTQASNAVVGFEKFVNDWTKEGLAENQKVHDKRKAERGVRHKKQREATKKYQIQLLKEREEKARKDAAFINKIRNAKVWE